MGCNIHAYIEARKRSKVFSRKWKLIEVYPYKKYLPPDSGYGGHRSRNYILYAYLADVRNYSDKNMAVFPRKGVPKDASELYREIIRYDGSDGHSHSWLSLEELRKLPWDLKLNVGTEWEETLKKTSKDFWQEIMLPMETIEALKEYEVRVVFHFDN